MNRAKRVLITFLAAVMVLSIIPFSASAATSNTQRIFDFLVDEMGLNSAAACGVLANIECESDFDPYLYGDNGTSYGICQWHAERFTNLKNYCSKKGLDWKSLDGQLRFLDYELTNFGSDTGNILSKLKNVPDTADGAYDAGYAWCYYFERPANKTTKAENRGNMAKNTYWPKYHREAYSIGDVNGDTKINSADALLVIECSVGSRTLDSTQKKRADLTKDGKITSEDALAILKVSTGSESIKKYQ